MLFIFVLGLTFFAFVANEMIMQIKQRCVVRASANEAG
jgi:hypothetical protein